MLLIKCQRKKKDNALAGKERERPLHVESSYRHGDLRNAPWPFRRSSIITAEGHSRGFAFQGRWEDSVGQGFPCFPVDRLPWLSPSYIGLIATTSGILARAGLQVAVHPVREQRRWKEESLCEVGGKGQIRAFLRRRCWSRDQSSGSSSC